ncbi:MAG: pyridoxal 5'-phosphate synthase glutaminase subunit PdxT [Anaerolineales bacterium]|nr:pyridoxal 5'-phosphate synthase glutaminase subunit PdxT [Anaerolineales bacterium]
MLALQGAFREHGVILRRIGVAHREVRLPGHLRGLDGLIIPGGESTTIGKLAREYSLLRPMRALAHEGKAVWGTCAGAILLAKQAGSRQPLLGLMDIAVQRNAFGRQLDSFETPLEVGALTALGEASGANGSGPRPFHGVFIRAPLISSVGSGVEVLARLPTGEVVAARQDGMLATVFHPELTDDDRFHRLFLDMIALQRGAVTAGSYD